MSEATATDPAKSNATTVVGGCGRRLVNPLKIERRDFRNPVLLAENDLRRVRNQHTEFARHFSAKVSAFLRLEFNLTLAELTTMAFARFTEGLTDPAHLTLFKIEPLAGLGIVSLPPTLGLAITNRMLGGRGGGALENRALTEIEIGLLEDFLRMIVEEWCRQWQDLPDPRPLLVGHETHGKFLQTSPAGTNMLVVSLQATLGEAAPETLQIAMPYAALENSIKKTPVQRPREPRQAPAPDQTAMARRAAYAGISLPAVADWLVGNVTLRDVLHLRAGDVLELPSETLAQTRISLTGEPLFIGTAGVRDGRVAVRLDRRIGDAPEPGPVAEESFSSFLAK